MGAKKKRTGDNLQKEKKKTENERKLEKSHGKGKKGEKVKRLRKGKKGKHA